MSKLTALQSAALAGKSIQLSGRGLPPSLTYLRLADVHAGKPLPTVSIQVLLQHPMQLAVLTHTGNAKPFC